MPYVRLVRSENTLRVVKALAMKSSGANSAPAQEREVYDSEAYLSQI